MPLAVHRRRVRLAGGDRQLRDNNVAGGLAFALRPVAFRGLTQQQQCDGPGLRTGAELWTLSAYKCSARTDGPSYGDIQNTAPSLVDKPLVLLQLLKSIPRVPNALVDSPLTIPTDSQESNWEPLPSGKNIGLTPPT